MIVAKLLSFETKSPALIFQQNLCRKIPLQSWHFATDFCDRFDDRLGPTAVVAVMRQNIR
jgi:hypothetical protein